MPMLININLVLEACEHMKKYCYVIGLQSKLCYFHLPGGLMW